jgi:hypothetical protein
MSINTSALFKKGKNFNSNNVAMKVNESHLFSKQSNNLPKKIDYTKISDKKAYKTYMSENVVLNMNDYYGSEKRNYNSNNDE